MNASIRHLVLLTVAFVVSSCLAIAQTTITVLHVNDTHSHLESFGPKDFHLNGKLGGIARAASVIASERTKDPNVLLLHGGDLFHGDFMYNQFFGVPELQMMQGEPLAFDAMAVGNHELEGGPDPLYGVLATAFGSNPAFPLLSANIYFNDYPGLTQYIQPATMKTLGGIRVGIFGMTVPNDPTEQTAGASGSIGFETDVAAIAAHMVDSLRNSANADVVVCLSHLGFQYDQGLAAGVPGIDVIVGAHNHYLFEKPVIVTGPSGKPTIILQAGSYYLYVGKLTLQILKTGGKVTVKMKDYRVLPVDERTPRFPQIQAVVDQLKQQVLGVYGDVYHKVVGMAALRLSHLAGAAERVRDTPLGDLVTDSYRRAGKTDVAITANGFIDQDIYAGPIVGNDIFHAVGYGYDQSTGLGFRLQKLSMTGLDLITGLEATLSYLGASDDLQLQVSGMRITYDGSKPPLSRVVSCLINGKPVDPAATYTVTTNDGIVAFLPSMGIHATPLPPPLDFEYNVVRNYIRQLGLVCYRPQGRIIDISIGPGQCRKNGDEGDAEAAGVMAAEGEPAVREFSLEQNYPNPFNPSTRISYSVPALSHLTVRIYNMLGQEVATLVDGVVSPGRYDVEWNATSFASGVYFCRMSVNGENGSGGFSSTRRLMLLK